LLKACCFLLKAALKRSTVVIPEKEAVSQFAHTRHSGRMQLCCRRSGIQENDYNGNFWIPFSKGMTGSAKGESCERKFFKGDNF